MSKVEIENRKTVNRILLGSVWWAKQNITIFRGWLEQEQKVVFNQIQMELIAYILVPPKRVEQSRTRINLFFLHKNTLHIFRLLWCVSSFIRPYHLFFNITTSYGLHFLINIIKPQASLMCLLCYASYPFPINITELIFIWATLCHLNGGKRANCRFLKFQYDEICLSNYIIEINKKWIRRHHKHHPATCCNMILTFFIIYIIKINTIQQPVAQSN